MSNLRKISFRTSVIISLFFCFYSTALALDPYTVLVPLPGTTVGNGDTATFQSYLPGAFNLAIGISAVLAFVMITYGGILYATSDALLGKSSGREYIENAVWGLLLVLGAWAILYTINPQMLEFNLNLPVPKLAQVGDTVTSGLSSGKVVPGYKLSDDEVKEDLSIRNDLWNSSGENTRIHVNSTVPCKNGETVGCSNLVGLPDSAIADIKELNKECNCEIIITGGTEGGHVSHGPGKPVVDLRGDALTSYIKGNSISAPKPTKYGNVYQVKVGGSIVEFLDEAASAPGSTGAHWHVVF